MIHGVVVAYLHAWLDQPLLPPVCQHHRDLHSLICLLSSCCSNIMDQFDMSIGRRYLALVKYKALLWRARFALPEPKCSIIHCTVLIA